MAAKSLLLKISSQSARVRKLCGNFLEGVEEGGVLVCGLRSTPPTEGGRRREEKRRGGERLPTPPQKSQCFAA